MANPPSAAEWARSSATPRGPALVDVDQDDLAEHVGVGEAHRGDVPTCPAPTTTAATARLAQRHAVGRRPADGSGARRPVQRAGRRPDGRGRGGPGAVGPRGGGAPGPTRRDGAGAPAVARAVADGPAWRGDLTISTAEFARRASPGPAAVTDRRRGPDHAGAAVLLRGLFDGARRSPRPSSPVLPPVQLLERRHRRVPGRLAPRSRCRTGTSGRTGRPRAARSR